jgi:UDP-2,4-diacetamido-2,4,6-trideoxy-beta-L-altropyranose hydrolase
MNVVIRTDASRIIGTGHVMRCLSLAEALSDKGASVRFICRLHDGHLCDLIEERGFRVQSLALSTLKIEPDCKSDYSAWLGASWRDDAAETIAAIEALGFKPDWLIVDHYAVDSDWEDCVRASVGRIMVIDDLADRKHECDLLLDQNLYEDADARYLGLVPAHCQLLIGPRFALLRDEFRLARAGLAARSGPIRRILVFFGGSDSADHTNAVLDALNMIELSEIGVDVVIRELHRNRKNIEAVCCQRNFVCHIQTSRLAKLMSEADIAIGAGGTSTWERCCLGLPCLTFVVADNQRRQVNDAALAGILIAPDAEPENIDAVAAHLQSLIDNPLLRESISRKSISIVDEYGAERVRRAIGIFSVTIREANAGDSEQIFEWRNSETVREMSLNSAPIDWPTHCAWFESVMSDPDRPLLIGESAGQPVGVVRFDITGDEADLSIYLVPGQANRGFGSDLLLVAEQWLINARPDLRLLSAEVLATNDKSQRLFAGAGYCAGTTEYSKKLR